MPEKKLLLTFNKVLFGSENLIGFMVSLIDFTIVPSTNWFIAVQHTNKDAKRQRYITPITHIRAILCNS